MHEYRLLRDVKYERSAEDGLVYSSPCRGMWNIVHIGTQIPGCHQIYVCPTSCLRGVVLTTAEMGAMDRLSTIAVGEDNILEGDMEETLQNGVEKVIAALPERPRMVMIFISCIHHFLAADYRRVYRVLQKKYPDIDFVDAYMDPIMRKKSPPIPSLVRQTYRVLQKKDTEDAVGSGRRQINIIGNWFASSAYNDLTVHLRKNGIDVRDLAEETDYDRFLEMGRSSLYLTFHKYAAKAGRDLEIRLGGKWMQVRPSFSFAAIDRDTEAVCAQLGITPPGKAETEALREKAERRAEELRLLLGETAVSVDYTAVDRPLEFCLFLHNRGFQVSSCFVDGITEEEKVFRELQEKCPELKLYEAESWRMRRAKRGHTGRLLAVGQKAAYYGDTPHFVNIINGADMYGYRGILRLLELMEEAYLKEKDAAVLIERKGLGCRAK